MQWILAFAALVVLALTGCYSVPVEDLAPARSEPPLAAAEIDRMSQAGLSDEVILEQIDRRGVVEVASSVGASDRVLAALMEAPARDPAGDPVDAREIVIPLWPSYSAGRWRWGLRIEAASRRTGRPAKSTGP